MFFYYLLNESLSKKEDNDMKKKVKLGIAKKLLVMILPVAAIVMAGILLFKCAKLLIPSTK